MKKPTTIYAIIVLVLVVIGLAIGLFFSIRKTRKYQDERALVTKLLGEKLEALKTANMDLKTKLTLELDELNAKRLRLDSELRTLKDTYVDKKAAILDATSWDDLVE